LGYRLWRLLEAAQHLQHHLVSLRREALTADEGAVLSNLGPELMQQLRRTEDFLREILDAPALSTEPNDEQ
jgi:hypothetical protein